MLESSLLCNHALRPAAPHFALLFAMVKCIMLVHPHMHGIRSDHNVHVICEYPLWTSEWLGTVLRVKHYLIKRRYIQCTALIGLRNRDDSAYIAYIVCMYTYAHAYIHRSMLFSPSPHFGFDSHNSSSHLCDKNAKYIETYSHWICIIQFHSINVLSVFALAHFLIFAFLLTFEVSRNSPFAWLNNVCVCVNLRALAKHTSQPGVAFVGQD